jgi:hypothetical protein
MTTGFSAAFIIPESKTPSCGIVSDPPGPKGTSLMFMINGIVTARRIGLLRNVLVVSLLLAVAASWPAFSGEAEPDATASLPPERQYGSIRYTTGGVTQEEAAAFRRERRGYPLAIELLEQVPGAQRSQYTADAIVRISNSAGQTVFEARAEGPFMLVRLASGRYGVRATLGGRTLEKKNVAVDSGQGRGPAQVTFVFPAGAD